jgi:hypothetical protein
MITITKPWALEKDLKELLEKKPSIKEFEEAVIALVESHTDADYDRYDNLAEVIESADKRVLMDVLSDLFEPSDIVKDGEWI